MKTLRTLLAFPLLLALLLATSPLPLHAQKISALPALTSAASGDKIPITDISDTTSAESGTTKYITVGNLSAAITPGWSAITGKPTTLSGYGITDAQPIDADLTALAAVSGTNTIYYRSASNTWSAVTIGAPLSFSAGTLSSTVRAISTPAIYYVESTGNDGTAVAGDPSRPYLTAQAAYDAGVTAANPFALHLGSGIYDINLTADWSALCSSVTGCGMDPAGDWDAGITALNINSPVELFTNANASGGVSINVALWNLGCFIAASGNSVVASDGDPHTAGNAGAVTLRGNALVYIIADGGGDGGSTDGMVNSGAASVINLTGVTLSNTGGIQSVHGNTYGGGTTGGNGSLTADGCDLRGGFITVSSTPALGRCSYATGLTITNKGGNAIW